MTLSICMPRGRGHRAQRARPLAVALLLGLGVGCGDSEERPGPATPGRPSPGWGGFSYEPCDILTDGCQRELFELVACVRGDTNVGDPPPIRRLDEANAIALIE